MTSHIVGGVLGIVATVMCIIFAVLNNNVYGVASAIIYGISLMMLYTMSSIYHGLNPKRFSKKVFQILDHCSIFLLIAGTYAPFTLVSIRGYDASTGWWMFGIIWAMAIIGIVLNSIDIKKYSKFSMLCYLVMGWCIIIKANILPEVLSKNGLILLITGGVAYTIGAVLYAIGKKFKLKYAHSTFHLFVLAGSVLHFICILLYVM